MTATHIALILIVWLSAGLARAESEPDPAAILEQQTERRRQEEIARLTREQSFDRSQFEQELERFDQKASRTGSSTVRFRDERRLQRSLNDIRTRDGRNQAQREQALRRLELGDRADDQRQRQALERLRHRQRADAFVNRQKLRLRRSQLNARGHP